MAFEVTMPQMGADMTEGTVVKWLKQPGDHVERGDIIAEIETDKATVELEAFEAGDILKLVANEGDVIPVGEVIALLGEAGEQVGEPDKKKDAEQSRTRIARIPEQAKQEAGADEEPAASAVATETDSGERIRISPVARRIASEAGLDVRGLEGSGPDGRILRRDVEAALEGKGEAAAAAPAASPDGRAEATAPAREAAAAAPSAPPVATARGRIEPLSRMRATIARRMTQSKQQQPHYYLTLDVDMTEALTFRKSLNAAASEEQKVSINDLVVKAVALALERHPKFAAQYAEDGLHYAVQLDINIGIALDEGLIAPAILDCGHKSLGRIAQESKELIERARENKLRADEYSAGVFTITNLGAYGVETLIGIINPPQAAILGVGSVMPQPVVKDAQVVVRQVMKVALSADHRVSDGAEGARFIKEIQSLLENPVSLAL